MKGYVHDIEDATRRNEDFRRVVYTAKHMQLVLMALEPGEEIGEEIHDVDQFFRIEAGVGEVVIDGERSLITRDTVVVVPAGARHNVVNTGSAALKLYTIYSPPHHRDALVEATRAEAMQDEGQEWFDGRTTERPAPPGA
jgi:mannose-6-phosphate isomerase-like protein (cupin superfamily)